MSTLADYHKLGRSCGINPRRLHFISQQGYRVSIHLNTYKLPGWRKKWSKYRKLLRSLLPATVFATYSTRRPWKIMRDRYGRRATIWSV